MMNLGFKGLLLLLAMVLFIVGALSEENQQDLLFWGLAIFASAHIVDSLPLGSLGPNRTRDRDRDA
jgi:hypothetical protein